MPLCRTRSALFQFLDQCCFHCNQIGPTLTSWDILLDPVERLTQLRFVPITELVEGIAAFVAQAMKPNRHLAACFIGFIFIYFRTVVLGCTPYPFTRRLGIQAMRPNIVLVG